MSEGWDGPIACACLGPVGDDPYCPCDMRQRDLIPTSLWTPEKIAELRLTLDKMYALNPASEEPK